MRDLQTVYRFHVYNNKYHLL